MAQQRPSSVRHGLPRYAEQLMTFHQAFAVELSAAVRMFPFRPGMRVLDVGSGDGFYTYLLAELVGSHGGSVVGLDILASYCDYAREHRPQTAWTDSIEIVQGELAHLPLAQGSFDAVWCAQSLYSLPNPLTALQTMRAALRPGGFVAILENDTLHQLLLPWPEQIELALRTAELRALQDTRRRPTKFYIGRRLPAVLVEADLNCEWLKTQAIDRRAPLDASAARFVELYLQEMAQRVAPYIDAGLRNELSELVDARSTVSLLRQPTLNLTWLNVLALGRKSETAAD